MKYQYMTEINMNKMKICTDEKAVFFQSNKQDDFKTNDCKNTKEYKLYNKFLHIIDTQKYLMVHDIIVTQH